MARDGGFCNCCGKHHIHSGVDFATGKDRTNLLIIELQDETSVPKVSYKGKEITSKANVNFDWDTKDAYGLGGLTYGFEHLKPDGTVEVIERRTKEHR